MRVPSVRETGSHAASKAVWCQAGAFGSGGGEEEERRRRGGGGEEERRKASERADRKSEKTTWLKVGRRQTDTLSESLSRALLLARSVD